MDFIDLKTQQNRIRDGLKTRFDHILEHGGYIICLLYTSPSPRDVEESRMPSSA